MQFTRLPLFLICMGALIGCDPGCAKYNTDQVCTVERRFATPIYTSKSELRNAVSIDEPRPIDTQLSKLSLSGQHANYLFLIDNGKGIHVVDFRNDQNPINSAFINIPGVSEIQLREDALYADSFTDLLVFDISNPEEIVLAGREQDVFPWTTYRAIPDDIKFESSDISSSRGVITGFREKGQ